MISLEGVDAGTARLQDVIILAGINYRRIGWSYENDEERQNYNAISGQRQSCLFRNVSRTMVSVSYANEFLRQSTPEMLSSRGITNPTTVADIELYRKEVRD